MSMVSIFCTYNGSASMPNCMEIADECPDKGSSGELGHALATFAGGCFWCMVAPFGREPGVKKVISGYTGGHKEAPTYQEVLDGSTGHFEAVQIAFDPAAHTPGFSISSGNRYTRLIPEGSSTTGASHTALRFSTTMKTNGNWLRRQRKHSPNAASSTSP